MVLLVDMGGEEKLNGNVKKIIKFCLKKKDYNWKLTICY